MVSGIRGPVLSPTHSSSLLHANYSPLRAFRARAVVDAALESSASALFNAVSMAVRKPSCIEWLACKSELACAGLSCGPLNHIAIT